MEILKSIFKTYLFIIAILLVLAFILYPVFLVDYYGNENYYYMFLFNIPTFLGVIYHTTKDDETHNRPRR